MSEPERTETESKMIELPLSATIYETRALALNKEVSDDAFRRSVLMILWERFIKNPAYHCLKKIEWYQVPPGKLSPVITGETGDMIAAISVGSGYGVLRPVEVPLGGIILTRGGSASATLADGNGFLLEAFRDSKGPLCVILLTIAPLKDTAPHS